MGDQQAGVCVPSTVGALLAGHPWKNSSRVALHTAQRQSEYFGRALSAGPGSVPVAACAKAAEHTAFQVLTVSLWKGR